MRKLENKIVFVAGGNSGIGRATALQAAKEGATIVVADFGHKDHRQTMSQIKAVGGECMFVATDVDDAESVKQAINKTVEEYGRLDVVFNNAGVGGVYSGIHDMAENAWNKLIALNLHKQLYCIKCELHQFLKQVTSAVIMPVAFGANSRELSGTKQSVALQYCTQNKKANTTCPCYVDTPLIQREEFEEIKNYCMQTDLPARELCKPKRLAKAFIYVFSS